MDANVASSALLPRAFSDPVVPHALLKAREEKEEDPPDVRECGRRRSEDGIITKLSILHVEDNDFIIVSTQLIAQRANRYYS